MQLLNPLILLYISKFVGQIDKSFILIHVVPLYSIILAMETGLKYDAYCIMSGKFELFCCLR